MRLEDETAVSQRGGDDFWGYNLPHCVVLFAFDIFKSFSVALSELIREI